MHHVMHTTLVLTHDCNLACTYCYAGAKERRVMPDHVAAAGIDLAFQGFGPVDLGFFGGEPLLRFDQLVAIAHHARSRAEREGRAITLSVTTNGTLLTRERVEVLRELGVRITLSIDGNREAHDATRPTRNGRSSFDATVRGARGLIDAGLPLEVIAVVAPANVRHLGETVRVLGELGARQIVLNPCFEESWSDDDLAAWERGMREAAQVYAAAMRAGRAIAMPTFDNKILAAAKGGLSACDTCSAGEREIAVAPSGNLYPCARLVNEDRDTRWVIGDVRGGVVRRTVEAIPRGPSDSACDTCAERWRCGASCMCANLAETNTPNMPGGVQCWYEQTSAAIADEIGHVLLEERCAAFLAWTYGRVAAAASEASREENAKPSSVRRVRRLPVLRGAA
jgi:uncharacterized protein